MKVKNVYIAIICVLSLLLIGIGIKLFLLNRDYISQKNILEETEKQITLLKNQIKDRCPDKFSFVD